MLSDSDIEDDSLLDEHKQQQKVDPQRQAMEDMEDSLGNFFLEENPDHPRLKTIIAELDTEGEQQRIKATLHVLAELESNGDRDLRDALVQQLWDLRQ